MKKIKNCILLIIMITLAGSTVGTASEPFTDVPVGGWAESYILKANDLGIISGYGDGLFGYGNLVTRAQFAAMLVRLFDWEKVTPDNPTFVDNLDESVWYYSEIETAVANGAVIKESSSFRPNDTITREDMAVMLIRALGYDSLVDNVTNTTNPFSDVFQNKGYITLAYDFGMINGKTETTFDPKGYATREQAAAMMIRLYDKFSSKLQWLHAFYAISSYSQKNSIPELNALSFGWSQLQFTEGEGPILNTTATENNDFYIPNGYSEVVQLAKDNNVPANLNIYMSTDQEVEYEDGTSSNVCEEILLDANVRSKTISSIIETLKQESYYSGVTIDFEGMKGTALKTGLNEFLKELREEIDKLGLQIYVCVPPVTSDGYYFDAYDYKTIGQYADKVILMAHDYQATTLTTQLMNAGFTTTPVTPINEIYFALKTITDSETGVEDTSKIALAISFGSVQWSIQNGEVINENALRPNTSSIYNRLINPATIFNYSQRYQNPYITFSNEANGTNDIVWYEDERSISSKVELARMFGINSVSVWRLGLIPDYDDPVGKEIYYDVMKVLVDQRE